MQVVGSFSSNIGPSVYAIEEQFLDHGTSGSREVPSIADVLFYYY